MTSFFLESYWPALIVAVIGIAVFIAANKRVNDKGRYAGLGLIGLALVLALVSFFVETGREQVARRSKELAKAVAARDWKAVGLLMHDQVTIYGWKGRDVIVQGGSAYADESGLKSARVTSMQVTPDDPDITVTFSIVTDHDAKMAAFSVPSTWQLRWVKTDHGWLLRDIEAVSVWHMTREQIAGRFSGTGSR